MERIASMGTLAAGVGHDMNNLMLPVQGHLDLLRADSTTQRGRDSIAAIESSMSYLRNLARSMLMLAKDPIAAAHGASTDVETWWAQAQPLFKSVLPRGVRLQHVFTGPCTAQAAPHQLAQVIYNLVQNAGDALKGQADGRITVQAEFIAPEVAAQRGLTHANGVVQLRVIDNGPGMTEEVSRRCLEPFYSTKQKSVVSGLGLALVHSVMEALGGKIEVHSELGKGTTFILTLPAAPPASQERAAADAPARTAAVTVRDARLRAVIHWILRSLNLAAFDAESSPHDRADLWIVDGRAVDDAMRFAHEHDRSVIICDHPQRTPMHEQAYYLSPNPSPGALREAIRSALSASEMTAAA